MNAVTNLFTTIAATALKQVVPQEEASAAICTRRFCGPCLPFVRRKLCTFVCLTPFPVIRRSWVRC